MIATNHNIHVDKVHAAEAAHMTLAKDTSDEGFICEVDLCESFRGVHMFSH